MFHAAACTRVHCTVQAHFQTEIASSNRICMYSVVSFGTQEEKCSKKWWFLFDTHNIQRRYDEFLHIFSFSTRPNFYTLTWSKKWVNFMYTQLYGRMEKQYAEFSSSWFGLASALLLYRHLSIWFGTVQRSQCNMVMPSSMVWVSALSLFYPLFFSCRGFCTPHAFIRGF